MALQAIKTTYRGPTQVRGAKMIVRVAGRTFTVGFDYAKDEPENHRAACYAAMERLRWKGKMTGGCLDGSYVWVFTDHGNSPEVTIW